MDNPILLLIMGVGLAAACGFRVFLPMFAAALAAHEGMIQIDPSFAWLTSDAALWVLGTATVVEIAAYYVPWVDNLLDTIASPAAIVAGALMTAPFISGVDPLLQWVLALVVGGGVAGGVQTLTTGTRAMSTATTGGLGNPAVSTVEAGAATTLSVVSIVLPAVAGLMVLGLFVLVGRTILRRLNGRRPVQPA